MVGGKRIMNILMCLVIATTYIDLVIGGGDIEYLPLCNSEMKGSCDLTCEFDHEIRNDFHENPPISPPPPSGFDCCCLS